MPTRRPRLRVVDAISAVSAQAHPMSAPDDLDSHPTGFVVLDAAVLGLHGVHAGSLAADLAI